MKQLNKLFNFCKSLMFSFACIGIVIEPTFALQATTPEAHQGLIDFFKANNAHKKQVTWKEFFAPVKDLPMSKEDRELFNQFISVKGNEKAPIFRLTKFNTPNGDVDRIIIENQGQSLFIDVYGTEKLLMSINNQPVFTQEYDSMDSLLKIIKDIADGKRKIRMPASLNETYTIRAPTARQWEEMGKYKRYEYMRYLRLIYMEMSKLQSLRETGHLPATKVGSIGTEAGSKKIETGSESLNKTLAEFSLVWKALLTTAWGKDAKTNNNCGKHLPNGGEECVIAGYISTYGKLTNGRTSCGFDKNLKPDKYEAQVAKGISKCSDLNIDGNLFIECNPLLFGNKICVQFGPNIDPSTVTQTCIDKFNYTNSLLIYKGQGDEDYSKMNKFLDSAVEVLEKNLNYCYRDSASITKEITIQEANASNNIVSREIKILPNGKIKPKDSMCEDQKEACQALLGYSISISKTTDISRGETAEITTPSPCPGIWDNDRCVCKDGCKQCTPECQEKPNSFINFCTNFKEKENPSLIPKIPNPLLCGLGAVSLGLGLLCFFKVICPSKNKNPSVTTQKPEGVHPSPVPGGDEIIIRSNESQPPINKETPTKKSIK